MLFKLNIVSIGEVFRWVVSLGFHILGTEAHTRGSPFLKTDQAYSGSSKVPVGSVGMYAAYFVEQDIPLLRTVERDESSRVVSHMCARNGFQSYVRLSTTLPNVTPNLWLLYHPRTKVYGVTSAGPSTPRRAGTSEEDVERLINIALKQSCLTRFKCSLKVRERRDVEGVACLQIYKQCQRPPALLLREKSDSQRSVYG